LTPINITTATSRTCNNNFKRITFPSYINTYTVLQTTEKQQTGVRKKKENQYKNWEMGKLGFGELERKKKETGGLNVER
jgi:hypothetical protein